MKETYCFNRNFKGAVEKNIKYKCRSIDIYKLNKLWFKYSVVINFK